MFCGESDGQNTSHAWTKLEVKKCHVRDMRAILFEARRLQELRREDLLQEAWQCNANLHH